MGKKCKNKFSLISDQTSSRAGQEAIGDFTGLATLVLCGSGVFGYFSELGLQIGQIAEQSYQIHVYSTKKYSHIRIQKETGLAHDNRYRRAHLLVVHIFRLLERKGPVHFYEKLEKYFTEPTPGLRSSTFRLLIGFLYQKPMHSQAILLTGQ